MRAIFPNAELVITVQTSPALQTSLAIYPAMKIPKEIWGGRRYQDSLKASVKDSFYYEGDLRMFWAPPGQNIKATLSYQDKKDRRKAAA